MSAQGDMQLIQGVIDGLNRNPVARFSYTQDAFDQDIVDGVDLFDRTAGQNIPKAVKTDYNPTIIDKGVRAQGASIPRMAWNHFIGRLSYNVNKLVQKLFSFFGIYRAALAHNANEYDLNAQYKTGDICFITASVNGVDTYSWYRRVSVSPETISNIPVTVTLHWAQMREGPLYFFLNNVVLEDQDASNAALPTFATAIASLLQSVKNYLEWLNSNKANIASPALTGTPTVPGKTNAATNDGTLIATEAQVYRKQDKITATGDTNLLTAPASVGGQPGTKAVSTLAPTSHASTASTYGIGSDANYGHVKLNSSTAPVGAAVNAAVGSSGKAADASHVHPATAPTAAAKDWGTKIATTAYADNAAHPVGSYYIQFPVSGQSTLAGMFPNSAGPGELFGGGWTEMYAAENVFFRTGALGSLRGKQWNDAAKAFEAGTAGIEPDAVRDASGLLAYFMYAYSATGIFKFDSQANSNFIYPAGTGSGSQPAKILRYAFSNDVPTDSTNRPENRLIKVWKRIT